MMNHTQECACDACLLALMLAVEREERQRGWERWYRRDYDAIQRYVMRRCRAAGCATHSEDIVQESFVIGFRNVSSGRYQDQGKALCAYLYGIARNLVWDVVRQQRRESADDPFLELQPVGMLAVEDAVFLEQVLAFVTEAETRLSDVQRRILDGLYRHGHTSQEVGEVLAKSANNVRALALRAIRSIAEYLADRHHLHLSTAAVRLCLQMR